MKGPTPPPPIQRPADGEWHPEPDKYGGGYVCVCHHAQRAGKSYREVSMRALGVPHRFALHQDAQRHCNQLNRRLK